MAVGHLLLSLAIGAVADHAASLPSRLSSSRVIAAGESPQSPPVECSKQALANVLRMCGGLVHDGKCDVVLIGCGVLGMLQPACAWELVYLRTCLLLSLPLLLYGLVEGT